MQMQGITSPLLWYLSHTNVMYGELKNSFCLKDVCAAVTIGELYCPNKWAYF